MDLEKLKESLGLGKKEFLLISGSLITGLIHIYVGYNSDFTALTLAGLGFIGGTALFLNKKYRNALVAGSIPYTASQFVFYYQYYGLNLGPLAAIDKMVQLIFIVVGLIYLREKYKNSGSFIDLLSN